MDVLLKTLEQLGIRYVIVGSTASSLYGEPRMTLDLDVVVKLSISHVQPLLDAFPEPDYYVSSDAIREAVRTKFQFNILHLSSGLKVDMIVASDSEFDRSLFDRCRQLTIGSMGVPAFVAAPEDVIVKKLQYFVEGGSEKHLRDIVGMLNVQRDRIDRAYLLDWIARLQLHDAWALIVDRFPLAAG